MLKVSLGFRKSLNTNLFRIKLLLTLISASVSLLYGSFIIIDSIEVGGQPTILRYNRNFHKLYALDIQGHRLIAVDIFTDSLVSQLHFEQIGGYRYLAMNNINNMLYFVTSIDDENIRIYKIDCSTDQIVNSKAFRRYFTHLTMAFAPKINTIFIGFGYDDILIFDATNLDTIGPFNFPGGMVLNMATDTINGYHYLYVLRGLANTLMIYDLTMDSAVAGIAIDPDYSDPESRHICVNSKNHYLYTTYEGGRRLSAIDIADLATVAYISLETSIYSITCDPLANHVYATLPSAGKVAVIDASVCEIIEWILLDSAPYSVEFDHGKNLLFVSCSNGKIYILKRQND